MKVESNGVKMDGTPEEVMELLRLLGGFSEEKEQLEFKEGDLVTFEPNAKAQNGRIGYGERMKVSAISELARSSVDPFYVRVISTVSGMHDWAKPEDLILIKGAAE